MAIEPNTGPDGVHGSSRVEEGTKKGTNWLLWLLLGLGLLALLFALSRCNRDEATTNTVVTTTENVTETDTVATNTVVTNGTVAADAGAVPVAGSTTVVSGPGGTAVQEVRTYLASSEPVGRRFNFDQINFAFGSAVVPAAAQPVVNELAGLMRDNPNSRVRIEGHADAATGTAAENRAQGAQRAEAVKAALVSAGVPANRIETASAGQTEPTATNATPAGRAENRRVDLVVLAR